MTNVRNDIRNIRQIFTPAVIVSALGYFVDIYDLILFSIVRIPSLIALGKTGEELFSDGILLLNMQMFGMLLGGVFWGILGDKRGRLSILFGSIFLYSLANVLNAFVTDISQYALLRFIAGIGLAGELGAGITLVAESLPKELRGYGTMIVASVGVTGALLANFVAKYYDWQVAFALGGILGFALLFLRVKVMESSLFGALQNRIEHKKINFFALFSKKERFFRYLYCLMIGFPTWFVVGILVSFAKEFAEVMHVSGNISNGDAIMYCYSGLVVGDIASGIVSQVLRSRRKVLFIFYGLMTATVAGYLQLYGATATTLYLWCGLLGISAGFWAIFVTISAEQFGTNLRATVATTVPNFARGLLIPISSAFAVAKLSFGLIPAAYIVGISTIIVGIAGIYFSAETFGRDLDFVEEI